MFHKPILFLILIAVIFSSCSKEQAIPEPEDPGIEEPAEEIETWTGLQIVMFTPSDIILPDDYKERMKEVVDYAQWFFEKWCEHWGYSCENPLKIQRDEDGYPILWNIKGKYTNASGQYDELGYASTEVIPKAMEQYNIPEPNQTWWIFSYPGPSSKAYRGGGNFRGGTSSCNFKGGTGTIIEPGDDNLATGNAYTFLLKAVIHELTHALGIAHIGPLSSDDFGNSLMGSTNNSYHKVFPNDDRVYLTETSAAILWKHPLFGGDFENVKTTPEVKITDVQIAYDKQSDVFNVTGKLSSNVDAHSVIVVNDSEADISDYWRKSFKGNVLEDGSFSCQVKELAEASGKLVVSFCFDNGAVSGETEKFGISNGAKYAYAYEGGTYNFN